MAFPGGGSVYRAFTTRQNGVDFEWAKSKNAVADRSFGFVSHWFAKSPTVVNHESAEV